MRIFLTSIFLLFCNKSFAQSDTVKIAPKADKTPVAYYIIPSTLISYGIAAQFIGCLQTLDHKIDKKIQQNIHRKYKFDDYIQYTPYLGIYGLDLCGVKSKHHFLDRTLVLGTSMIFASIFVQGTKNLTQVERPDQSNYHSFPSGHTTTTFMGAHILFKEYKDKSVLIGITGYSIALTTASMRIINRKHWLSDVVTSAGAGILCVELSYQMLPVWHKFIKITDKNQLLVFCPRVSQDYLGMNILTIF